MWAVSRLVSTCGHDNSTAHRTTDHRLQVVQYRRSESLNNRDQKLTDRQCFWSLLGCSQMHSHSLSQVPLTLVNRWQVFVWEFISGSILFCFSFSTGGRASYNQSNLVTASIISIKVRGAAFLAKFGIDLLYTIQRPEEGHSWAVFVEIFEIWIMALYQLSTCNFSGLMICSKYSTAFKSKWQLFCFRIIPEYFLSSKTDSIWIMWCGVEVENMSSPPV